MDDPGLVVAALLAALGVSAAGASVYLAMTRRKTVLLMSLVDKRRLRR